MGKWISRVIDKKNIQKGAGTALTMPTLWERGNSKGEEVETPAKQPFGETISKPSEPRGTYNHPSLFPDAPENPKWYD